MAPARHDLVWLAPRWQRALAAPVDGPVLAAVEAWFSRDLPAVAARRDGGAPEALALGVALPPGGPTRRAALHVARSAAARTSLPLALAEAVSSAPDGWRAPLVALERRARAAGLVLRVYGSLAWQHLSGARYLTAASDVDLLVAVRDAPELRRALRLLRAHAGAGSPRLDGEILLPGGFAIAWRELAARPSRLLVKSAAGVALVPTRDALGPLVEGLG